MKAKPLLFVGPAILVLAMAASMLDAQSREATAPRYAATYDELLQRQSLGRFVVARDGSFFVYEWSRPYNWVPDSGKLPLEASTRAQTFLYKVSTPDEWGPQGEPTSESLFPAMPGATYYLGTLSPDGRRISFYELDRDDNQVRAGVVLLSDSSAPPITWLKQPPDYSRLAELPLWISNEEITYPVRLEAGKQGRANVVTGKVALCRNDCIASRTEPSLEASVPVAESLSTLPAAARIVARSDDSRLVVYSVDNSESLSLYLRKNNRTVTIFENSRRSMPPTAVR